MLFIVSAIIIIILLVIIWTIAMYNKFVTLRERVTNGKAQIAAQMESRWDAVENLISATKDYTIYEAETLEAVTEKRIILGGNSSVDEIERDDAQLDRIVSRLIAVSENYPDLKASDVYISTMKSIHQFENHVRGSRMIYNDVVTKFNRRVHMFPSNMVAAMFKFTTTEYFHGAETKKDMPKWN